mgnify:CR=1 FL=1
MTNVYIYIYIYIYGSKENCSTNAHVYGDVGILEAAGREGVQPRFVDERGAGCIQMLDKCLYIWT